jgi:hypothetical protein
VVLLRYLDVCLVLATAPFVFAGGMPTVGYGLGAGAWLLTRAFGAVLTDRALRAADARVKAGLQVAAMMSRIWIVALGVILARYVGGKDDGVMAAGLVLAAFTVYLAISFVNRPGSSQRRGRTESRPPRPSTS